MKKESSHAVPAVVGCLVVQLCVGIIYLWSVLKVPYINALGMTAENAAMVSSYMLMAFVVGCLFGGICVDKKGPRFTCILGVCLFSVGIGSTALLGEGSCNLIYATYAGLGGLGSGFAYSACISCIQKWMPTRRGLASGLAVAAFGLSTVIFAPVFTALMKVFTGADGLVNFTAFFAVLAGVFLVIGLVACAFIRSAPAAVAGAAKDTKSFTLKEAIRNKRFWYIFVAVFTINGAWNLATPLLKPLGIDRGLTDALATAAVSCTGIASAAGRLVMAALADKLGCRTSLVILSLLTVLASVAMIFLGGYGYFIAVALLAFAYGGPSSVNAAITTNTFGPAHSGSIYGVILLALGASSLFFNAIANNLLGGDVTATFIMAAISACVPMVMMYLLKVDAAKAEKA